jgi:DNA-binding NtrC family response regulator
MNSARILVIDDEKNVRFTVIHALQNDGYQVDAASSGVDGLQKASQIPYDLLLVDLRMPGMTGVEMLRELRRQHTQVPAVIITAYGIPRQLVEAAELGAIDCVRKPFSIQTIRHIVRDVIETCTLPDDFVPGTANEHLMMGRHEMMNGRLETAKTFLEKAAELSPDRAEIHILLGVAAYLRGGIEAATSCFERALTIDPSSKTASEYLTWLASTEH